MRVVASAEAIEFIRDHGGMLWVWPRHPVRPGLVTLETATDHPAGDLRFEAVHLEAGFRLFLDPRGWGDPEFLDIELRGWRRPRVAAFWNGLAYLQ